MVSSALNTLRGMPQKQAQIYNGYGPRARSIRMDDYSSGPQRLKQLTALATAAHNAMQGLQDSANTAETTIRNKAGALNNAGPASGIDAVARQNILLGYQNNQNDVADVCKILVAQNDRAGFAALKSLLPYLGETSKADVVATFEQQLYSRDELMLLAEVYECDGSMSSLRMNFKALFDFFATQLLPGVVAGMFNRIESLWPWWGVSPQRYQDLGAVGVQWERLPQEKFLLTYDYEQDPVVLNMGKPPANSDDPAAWAYQVTGMGARQSIPPERPMRGGWR